MQAERFLINGICLRSDIIIKLFNVFKYYYEICNIDLSKGLKRKWVSGYGKESRRGREGLWRINATFNNISATCIPWRLVLLVKETGVPGENYWQVTDKLYHIMLYWVHLVWVRFELTTIVWKGINSSYEYRKKNDLIKATDNDFEELVTVTLLETVSCLDKKPYLVDRSGWPDWEQKQKCNGQIITICTLIMKSVLCWLML